MIDNKVSPLIRNYPHLLPVSFISSFVPSPWVVYHRELFHAFSVENELERNDKGNFDTDRNREFNTSSLLIRPVLGSAHILLFPKQSLIGDWTGASTDIERPASSLHVHLFKFIAKKIHLQRRQLQFTDKSGLTRETLILCTTINRAVAALAAASR